MRETTLSEQALNFVTNNGSDSSEWSETVKFLRKNLNIEEYLLNPESIKSKTFSYVCSNKLQDLVVISGKLDFRRLTLYNGQSTKFRFYSLIKTEFKREPCLENLNDFHLCKNM